MSSIRPACCSSSSSSSREVSRLRRAKSLFAIHCVSTSGRCGRVTHEIRSSRRDLVAAIAGIRASSDRDDTDATVRRTGSWFSGERGSFNTRCSGPPDRVSQVMVRRRRSIGGVAHCRVGMPSRWRGVASAAAISCPDSRKAAQRLQCLLGVCSITWQSIQQSRRPNEWSEVGKDHRNRRRLPQVQGKWRRAGSLVPGAPGYAAGRLWRGCPQMA